MTQKNETITMKTILNTIGDGVFSVDGNWRITSFNEAAEKITGINANEAIGKKCSDIFHADICENGCALRQAIETGQAQREISARILNSQGRSIPVILNAAVARDKKGKFISAIETFKDVSDMELLRQQIEQKYSFGDMVGKSKAFRKILATVPDVAQSDSAVLIEGPKGTGKELMARAIHNLSPRHKKDFVVIDCKTLQSDILDADLFGYEQQEGQNIKKTKPGKLAMAQGSTIYFDGIENLRQATQVKLLRVLKEREYEPLGSSRTIRTDVRVIASARTSLVDLISSGSFRDDLYIRLAATHLHLVSLQKRRTDIPLLLNHFIRLFNAELGKSIEGVEPDILQTLMDYSFPGNIAELRDIVEQACYLCENNKISFKHLPADFRLKMVSKKQGYGLNTPGASPQSPIQEAIRQADGHLGHAAALLGISRTTLWRKMKRLGLSTGYGKGD